MTEQFLLYTEEMSSSKLSRKARLSTLKDYSIDAFDKYCSDGNLEKVKCYNTHPNMLMYRGLLAAIRHGRLSVVSWLISTKGVSIKDIPVQYNPVVQAAYGPSIKVLKVLLDNGFDVNSREQYSLTPLEAAARSPKTFKVLLDYGANVNAKTPSGNNILRYTMWWGTDEALELLFSHDVICFNPFSKPNEFSLTNNTGKRQVRVYQQWKKQIVKYMVYLEKVLSSKYLGPEVSLYICCAPETTCYISGLLAETLTPDEIMLLLSD